MVYIDKVRIEKGIKITELCKKVGISRDTYYKWLNGDRKPKLQTIIKVCEILEIDFKNIVENFI